MKVKRDYNSDEMPDTLKAIAVQWFLRYKADAEGVTELSPDQIVTESGIARSTVYKALKELGFKSQKLVKFSQWKT